MSPSSPPLDQQAFRSDQWIFTSFRLTPNIHSVSLILFNSSELNVKFIRGKKHWEYLVEDGSSKIYIHIFFCLLSVSIWAYLKNDISHFPGQLCTPMPNVWSKVSVLNIISEKLEAKNHKREPTDLDSFLTAHAQPSFRFELSGVRTIQLGVSANNLRVCPDYRLHANILFGACHWMK
jgi:hypothetical protein